MEQKKAWLVLADETVLEGVSFGARGTSVGEVVFTTGMTGYQEVLTDPSFYGQLVAQTYPLIGNYGINSEDMQSDRCHLKGYIVREWCERPSNFRAAMTIDEFLKQQGVVGISEIDTRFLTKKLRDAGAMNGAVTTEWESCDRQKLLEEIRGFRVQDAVSSVSIKEIQHAKTEDGQLHVVLMDFGHRRSMVRSLQKRGCAVTIVPGQTKAEEILALSPDGVLLSNGPGNPAENEEIIQEIQTLLQADLPLFAIGLGHQLVALAAGAQTEKLRHGHRGANQPVKDLKQEKTFVTAQNHGYAVKEASIDLNKAAISHQNANDATVEGICYANKPCFTVQFHPEPGAAPCETSYLFDEFVQLMQKGAER